jgi:predicted NodU family carbamoyl transferase
VRDGKVVSAIPEERLDRVKQSRVFPSLAIMRCLEMGGLPGGRLLPGLAACAGIEIATRATAIRTMSLLLMKAPFSLRC